MLPGPSPHYFQESCSAPHLGRSRFQPEPIRHPHQMKREHVLQLIQECFDTLASSDLIKEKVHVDGQTQLLGPNSLLDSIAFVTFMVELEDRITQTLEPDAPMFSLSIGDIHDFNPDKASLTTGTLADFTVRATSAHA